MFLPLVSLLVFSANAVLFNGYESMIVDGHNEQRSTAALPSDLPASNMLSLTWNNGLAQAADQVASSCSYAHSTDGTHGQNIYFDNGPNVIDADLINSFLESWVSERVQDFPVARANYQQNGNLVGPSRHYSAMIWAETSTVGCAVGFCGGSWSRFVVCNYRDPGNYNGEGWYEVGSPCSQCPNGTSCNGQGLCIVGSGNPAPGPAPASTPASIEVPVPVSQNQPSASQSESEESPVVPSPSAPFDPSTPTSSAPADPLSTAPSPIAAAAVPSAPEVTPCPSDGSKPTPTVVAVPTYPTTPAEEEVNVGIPEVSTTEDSMIAIQPEAPSTDLPLPTTTTVMPPPYLSPSPPTTVEGVGVNDDSEDFGAPNATTTEAAQQPVTSVSEASMEGPTTTDLPLSTTTVMPPPDPSQSPPPMTSMTPTSTVEKVDMNDDSEDVGVLNATTTEAVQKPITSLPEASMEGPTTTDLPLSTTTVMPPPYPSQSPPPMTSTTPTSTSPDAKVDVPEGFTTEASLIAFQQPVAPVPGASTESPGMNLPPPTMVTPLVASPSQTVSQAPAMDQTFVVTSPSVSVATESSYVVSSYVVTPAEEEGIDTEYHATTQTSGLSMSPFVGAGVAAGAVMCILIAVKIYRAHQNKENDFSDYHEI